MQELAHSFNITLDEATSGKIGRIQSDLREHFTELRTVDPTAHCSLLLRFATANDTEHFVRVLSDEFKEDRPQTITFSACVISVSGTSLFLVPDAPSRAALMLLHERALRVAGMIGNAESGGAPERYPFEPHITLIKVAPEHAGEAREFVGDRLNGLTTSVESYHITVDDPDRTGAFVVVASLSLS